MPLTIRHKEFEPFHLPLTPLLDLFDFDLSDFRRAPNFEHRHGFSKEMMKLDIKDDGTNYVISADLPGCKKEEIEIELKEDKLTIRATRNEETDSNEKNYVHKERFCGVCARTIRVGDIKEEDIKAKFENGVLTLTFPKEKTEPPRKLIAIE